MELGALVCTARTPRCADCPVAASCAWLAAGSPAVPGPAKRRSGSPAPTGRCAGAPGVLRAAAGPVPAAALDAVWPLDAQRARALDGLVADGLVDPLPDGTFALPGHARPEQARPERALPDRA